MKMYRHEDYDQLKVEMPFGVTLREDNRWVILSKKFPWKEIDREYQEHFKSSEGQVAIPSRLAFGALYIQAEEGYTDEQTRRNMTRLPDTSMTSIAMGFFAANMERKLRLLFAPDCGWALDYDFDLGELVIFPRFPNVPAIQ